MDTNFITMAEKQVKSFQENQRRNRDAIDTLVNSIQSTKSDLNNIDNEISNSNTMLRKLTDNYGELDRVMMKSISSYNELIQTLNDQIKNTESKLVDVIGVMDNELTLKIDKTISDSKIQLIDEIKLFEETIHRTLSIFEKESQFSLKVMNNVSDELKSKTEEFTDKISTSLIDYMETNLKESVKELSSKIDMGISENSKNKNEMVSKVDSLIPVIDNHMSEIGKKITEVEKKQYDLLSMYMESSKKTEKNHMSIEQTIKGMNKKFTFFSIGFLLLSIVFLVLLLV